MDTLFFFYNLIIMICFVFSAVGFLLLYRRFKEKSLLCLALMFFLFTLDNLVLFMYEFLPSFTGYYDGVIIVEPYLLKFLTLIIIFSYRLTINSFRDKELSNLECIFWVVYLAMTFAATATGWRIGRLEISSLLISSASISVFAYGVYDRRKFGAYPSRAGKPNILLWILAASLLLETMAMVEKILAKYNIFLLPTTHRVLAVEILSILYSVLAISYLIMSLVDGSNIKRSFVPDREGFLDSFAAEYGLTAREREILPMILDGKTNAEICEIACISEGTVKSHTHNIYQKMNVKNRLQLSVKMNEFEEQNKAD